MRHSKYTRCFETNFIDLKVRKLNDVSDEYTQKMKNYELTLTFRCYFAGALGKKVADEIGCSEESSQCCGIAKQPMERNFR
jgi:hypothetical protein